ncbi:hypothetical protein [[Clostridium] fimetarium]|uniref:Uncharacterized protein n=1 Tax=[Clostridium] fimetarium TaxID=99656 RepID=A0A1I0RBF7_9FIRM|nr:hypothetical protein [[Clostridium] fimetarium]SEW38133.1 hypothetical protein SAMN05421659_113116 [[Clostridium] fimetarium]
MNDDQVKVLIETIKRSKTNTEEIKEMKACQEILIQLTTSVRIFNYIKVYN